MHMAPRVAAWVAWVVWTCNTGRKAGDSQKRAGFGPLFFLGYRKADTDTMVLSDSNSD
jgi:hypothetical protein